MKLLESHFSFIFWYNKYYENEIFIGVVCIPENRLFCAQLN